MLRQVYYITVERSKTHTVYNSQTVCYDDLLKVVGIEQRVVGRCCKQITVGRSDLQSSVKRTGILRPARVDRIAEITYGKRKHPVDGAEFLLYTVPVGSSAERFSPDDS